MAQCIAFNCTNRKRKNPSLGFFSFPKKDKKLLKQWTEAAKCLNFKEIVTENTKLCEEHFAPDQLTFNGGVLSLNYRKTLKQGAVPTIFICSSHKDYEKTQHEFEDPMDPLKISDTQVPTDRTNEFAMDVEKRVEGFFCSKCGKTFAKEVIFNRHINSNHLENCCKLCKYDMTPEEIEDNKKKKRKDKILEAKKKKKRLEELRKKKWKTLTFQEKKKLAEKNGLYICGNQLPRRLNQEESVSSRVQEPSGTITTNKTLTIMKDGVEVTLIPVSMPSFSIGQMIPIPKAHVDESLKPNYQINIGPSLLGNVKQEPATTVPQFPDESLKSLHKDVDRKNVFKTKPTALNDIEQKQTGTIELKNCLQKTKIKDVDSTSKLVSNIEETNFVAVNSETVSMEMESRQKEGEKDLDCFSNLKVPTKRFKHQGVIEPISIPNQSSNFPPSLETNGSGAFATPKLSVERVTLKSGEVIEFKDIWSSTTLTPKSSFNPISKVLSNSPLQDMKSKQLTVLRNGLPLVLTPISNAFVDVDGIKTNPVSANQAEILQQKSIINSYIVTKEEPLENVE